ncbi:CWF19-like protein 2 [Syngnathoides biaculeatus]|uniref:CWF19-like protein 2 n=1 Tax=Syngnathoides biaculeatus TaxID=300417 RepID=UPI002ADD6BD2|nr:CWF19-like protein 2 [Syngnathoides biaculeatus]
MAAPAVRFESTSSIVDRKDSKRQARQEAIDKAKQKYEREERRKELKRQRGEDTWMLPEVTDRLKEIEDETSGKSKKKKEKKSKKKKKKAKREKKATEGADGSNDSSNDSVDEWVEAQPQAQPAKAWKATEKRKSSVSDSDSAQNIQRDEWMTFDFLAMKTTSTAEKRAEKERQKEQERAKAQAIEQAGLHKLELNPYWKDGGTGLPPEEMAGTAAKKGAVVNDGGLSWLRKNYQRMKEQAEREQRSLDDVVADRYGSMEEFQQRLAEAEKAVYGHKNRGERDVMLKGRRMESRERWRRKGDEAEADRWRRYDRDSPPLSKERHSSRASDRERERDQDSQRNPNKDKDGYRFRDREQEVDEEIGRNRDGERPSVPCSSHKNWTQRSSSIGSLKGSFLKPSQEDDSRAPECPPYKARSSIGFLKPTSDDEGSGPHTTSAPAWKKSGVPVLKHHDFEKVQKVQDAAKPTPAPCHDKAAKSSESDSDEQVEELPLLSEEEMNKLGAKLVKAEIMGNTAMVKKLKAQLDAAHKANESHAEQKKVHERANSNKVADSEDRDVLLFRTDHAGQAWPVKPISGPQEPQGGRRKKKAIETHLDGQRVRYFEDDDHVGLKEMVRREKMSSTQDQNALYSRMAAKMMAKTDGDNYTLDDMFVSSAARKEGEGREQERLRNRATEESRRLAATMEKCRHCFGGQELQKHLIVAIGSKVYLSLPAGVSMTEGHCLICPLQHHCSATTLDEDVWSEIQLFRRSLVRMFESQELDCVFMETHMNPRRRQHMVLECIPLPRELGDMAPIYFKKAIMECDEEWAMNKKVVDLSSKDIRKAVPRGLPYFAVDFGLQGGFAHVIENEQKFPPYFGKEVVGGMMDVEPRLWRKLIRENFDDQRKKVLQFALWWKPYDCTKIEAQQDT